MPVQDELTLLIKSKYPVIFFESIDETFALKQLRFIARQLNFLYYEWSLTDGLKREDNTGCYNQTKEAAPMLKMILELLNLKGVPPGLFVLKDLHKCFETALTLRLFKDTINHIKNTRHTIVILSAEYNLPKDIEPECAHIIGGYPVEKEIESVLGETISELQRTNWKIEVFLSPEDSKRMINALKGLSIQQIRNVVNQCAVEHNSLSIQDLNAIESYKKKLFDQEGLLEFCLTEDKSIIAGFENLKRWLAERKDSFLPDQSLPLPPPRGVLLMGAQACGKSLAIKVIAREFCLPLYRLDLGRLYSKYIGETERNLRKALAVAEKLCPVCLWIDEIEKGFAASSGELDGGVSQRILGTFLTWMQEHKATCFVAATANDIDRLPPEFLRKGRFDEVFFVDLPDCHGREQLFEIHLKKRQLNPQNFECRKLVEMSPDFSGAEIEQAIISALYRASSEKRALTTEHILEQLQSTKPLSVMKREEILALRDWAKERTIPV